MKKILLFILVASIAYSQHQCTSFGVRIQYGNIFLQPSSPQKLVISFNTPFPCTSSYVQLISKKGLQSIRCHSNNISLSDNMNSFSTYVQKCPLTTQINFGETYHYQVYGWEASSQILPSVGMSDWVPLTVIDPVEYEGQVNILVLADWGVIETTGFTPITDTLRNVMLEKPLHLMVVNGDIAYNLDSNKGDNYVKFLKMIEEFTSQIPSVFVPGNHEHYSNDDQLLLNSTFQLYEVLSKKATGLQFADLYLLPFDPYEYVYQQKQTISSFDALKSQLAAAEQTQLFTVPFSHYPLTCSGESQRCLPDFDRMYNYFDAMVDAGVSLYFGAHAHQYQRDYPYIKNKTFKQINPPYQDNQGYLISIVEGVAGSNTDLVTQMPNVRDFTASYIVNSTGFGVLTANSNNQISYTHYSTRQGKADSVVIKKVKHSKASKQSSNLRSEAEVHSQ